MVKGLVYPRRSGYLGTLKRNQDTINFVEVYSFMHQNVFTSIDPKDRPA